LETRSYIGFTIRRKQKAPKRIIEEQTPPTNYLPQQTPQARL
jgi:hypothetical protein